MNLKIFKTKCGTTEKIFLGVLGLSLLLLLLSSCYSVTSIPVTIVVYFVLLVTFLLLAYISYIDFKTMEIANSISLALLLFLLAINLCLFFFLDLEVGLVINDRFSYIPYDNFFFALFLGLLFLLLVLVSKEKAMGMGDIRVAFITGLLIGKSNATSWVYITVFTALVYGLMLGYKKKSLKNLKIPFAPFMILGAIISLLVDMYF